MTDPARFRANFPALKDTVHLAGCSVPPRSDALDAALARMLDAMRRPAEAWHLFEEEGERSRHLFAALVGARPEQIALVPNASVGAHQAVSGLDLRRRPRIVTTTAEFPSLAHVWLARRPSGAEVVFAEDTAAGDGDEAGPGDAMAHEGRTARALTAAVDGRTALVSVPLVTYRTCERLPVARIARAARQVGARVLVDAYQAVGVEPVDVDELGCDFLVAGTSKYLLGLPGIAFLYVRDPGAVAQPPTLTGWFGRREPFAFDPRRLDWADSARRLETGTPPVPALYAATAGLELIASVGAHAVRDHVTALGDRATGLLTRAGERLLSPSDPLSRGAHVALHDADPAALAAHLARRDIAVAPRGDVVRLSLHYYSDTDDVDTACAEIERYRRSTAR
ncbi:aminotransferase class V-fold PLP-dependent enzyme [Streptomyces sp. NPDC059063]|uniref:aminotransferase class V-fold PLP-dependent enzyme n=1 Tax=unclassified Streptomyces TaxID=2593676 RepID=UPI0036A9ED5F